MPGELNQGAALADLRDFKAVPLQPGSDGLNVGVCRAELLSELFRRHPFVKLRRGLVLLIIKQLQQRGFLLRTAFEHQQHALHRQVGWSGSDFELGTGKGMDVALEHNPLTVIHRLMDQRTNVSLLRCGQRGQAK